MSEAEQVNDLAVCRQCRNRVELREVKKYPGNLPLVLTGLGVLGILCFIGAFMGIALILAGLYMRAARESVYYCPNCRYSFKAVGNR
ncbi:MAG: LITAF-like zinc ribbon domain-containing protein [Pseudomonadota bacterium]